MKNATKKRLIQIAHLVNNKWGDSIFTMTNYKTEIMKIARENNLATHWYTLNAGLPLIREEILKQYKNKVPKTKVFTCFIFDAGVLQVDLENGETIEYIQKKENGDYAGKRNSWNLY